MNSRKKELFVIVLLASLFLQIAQAAPTPPFLLENIQTNIETTTKVTIRWTTTVGTTSYIEYYPEENFTMWGIKGIPIIKEPYFVIDPRNEPSPTDYPYMLNHSMTLADLKPNTTYLFRIKAKDIYDYPEYYESNFTTAYFMTWGPSLTPYNITVIEKTGPSVVRPIFECILVVVIFLSLFFVIRREFTLRKPIRVEDLKGEQ